MERMILVLCNPAEKLGSLQPPAMRQRQRQRGRGGRGWWESAPLTRSSLRTDSLRSVLGAHLRAPASWASLTCRPPGPTRHTQLQMEGTHVPWVVGPTGSGDEAGPAAPAPWACPGGPTSAGRSGQGGRVFTVTCVFLQVSGTSSHSREWPSRGRVELGPTWTRAGCCCAGSLCACTCVHVHVCMQVRVCVRACTRVCVSATPACVRICTCVRPHCLERTSDDLGGSRDAGS